jgi:spermidine/putrescine transport system ATP-binding protein
LALLEIRDVTRRFGDFVAVDGVSLSIGAGEFFTLLGPSGCGKTTLLRMIAGFDQPDAGRIEIDGQDMAGVPPEDRNVHTVFQNYALFPHMTVEQNVSFPLRMSGCPQAELGPRVREALEDVSLLGMERRYPNELSGGQRQRVALARALINRPRLLLLDEPLAALDAKLKERMQLELITLQKEIGVTFIYVTHDQEEALALSHRIAVMNKGGVEQLDEPATIYGFPKNRFVADFIGECNILDCSVDAVHDGVMALEVEGLGRVTASGATDAVATGTKGALALRPEKVSIARELPAQTCVNRFNGRVFDYLYTGDVTLYIVEVERGKRVEVMLPNNAVGRSSKFFEPGDAVQIGWRDDAGSFLAD